MIDLNELDLTAQKIKGVKNIQKPAQIINLSSEINNTVFNANSIEQIIQLQKQKKRHQKRKISKVPGIPPSYAKSCRTLIPPSPVYLVKGVVETER